MDSREWAPAGRAENATTTETDPARIVRVGTAAVYPDRLAAVREVAWRLVRQGRDSGPARRHIGALLHLCLEDYHRGKWATVLAARRGWCCATHCRGGPRTDGRRTGVRWRHRTPGPRSQNADEPSAPKPTANSKAGLDPAARKLTREFVTPWQTPIPTEGGLLRFLGRHRLDR